MEPLAAAPETQTTTATPLGAVMDVVPPPPAEKNDAAAPAAAGTALAESAPADAAKSGDKKPDKTQLQRPAPPKLPKQPGVGLAIAATVIIVLGLAALATYAYLKSR